MSHQTFTKKDILQLVDSFEQLTLPKKEWSHLAHLIVGTHYAFHLDEQASLAEMRKRIIAYNQSLGIAYTSISGYHETLTRFWLILIKKFILLYHSTDAVEAIELMQKHGLANKNLPLKFYSKKLLDSKQARENWMLPDKLPLSQLDILLDPLVEPHYELSDIEFVDQLRDGKLNPGIFSHEAHIRLAYIEINQNGLETAIDQIKDDIRNYASSLGAPGKYHITLTVAAIYVVDHFMKKSASGNFYEFIHEFPQLKTAFKDLIGSHYSIDVYQSEKARDEFLAPDLIPFS